MANVNHSTLTDPYLHEPKGVASAATGSVYVSDGSGSGDWTKAHSHINGYLPFDATTPAYQHSVTTSYTVLDPTFSTLLADGFSGASSPNARLIYTDTQAATAFCNFAFNFKQASGSSVNLEVVFYKNGSLLSNGHIIATAASGEWRSATLSAMTSLATDDYIEIFVKGSASFTLDVAAASLTIQGVPS